MRPVKGALSMAMAAAANDQLRGLIVPSANAAEAAVVERIDVIPVNSVTQAAAFLIEQLHIEPTPSRVVELFEELGCYEEDFADVRGQEMAKRAVTILPQLIAEESIGTSRIYSAMGKLPHLAVR